MAPVVHPWKEGSPPLRTFSWVLSFFISKEGLKDVVKHGLRSLFRLKLGYKIVSITLYNNNHNIFYHHRLTESDI